MTYILGSGTLFPPHYYNQDQLADTLVDLLGEALFNPDRLRNFFQNVKVGGRHLALPKESYRELTQFGDRNRKWLQVALDLLERLTPQVLETTGLRYEDLGVLMSTTVTGLAVPTLEARLMNRLPIPASVRRVPLFGLGCLAGAAGVARLHDMLKGTADVGLLMAVELCSLTLQTQDLSVANLVSTGLFGDGAAIVAMCGSENSRAQEAVKAGRGCRIVDTRSAFFSDSEAVMGWEFDSSGFTVVLNSDVPQYAQGQVCDAVRGFLKEHGLTPQDIQHWLAHPGGPKVMQAIEEGLEIPGTLDISRRSLEEVGNISSVSVLCILDEVLRSEVAQPGDWGVLMAMGPAFCAEIVLLRWQT